MSLLYKPTMTTAKTLLRSVSRDSWALLVAATFVFKIMRLDQRFCADKCSFTEVICILFARIHIRNNRPQPNIRQWHWPPEQQKDRKLHNVKKVNEISVCPVYSSKSQKCPSS